MRKLLSILFIICALTPTITRAQNSFQIPNGNFENWSNGNGYSVSVLFFSLPVYNSYVYPTDWHFLTYPVNESINYSGFNVNINTEVPLLKSSQETSNVPEGNSALSLQTFMMSDIIEPTIYSLAQSSIDSEYLNMVAPSILATAEMDLDNILSLVTSVAANINDEVQLFTVLSQTDVNQYFNGGIPLNSFAPGKLTGSYKYASATSGDNGGILLIGTKYNTTTHRREVVGAGYELGFTDISEYTPFEVNYQSLHEINPTQFAEIEADSLIVMLISSANNENRQQGSVFTIDNLQLLERIVIPEEPDTCNSIYNLSVISIDTTSATLSWNNTATPALWQYTYCFTGATPDQDNVISCFDSTATLTNLTPDTNYDFYVRSRCSNGIYSEWASTSFKTDTLPTPVVIIDSTGIESFTESQIQITPNPAHGQCHVAISDGQLIDIQVFNIEGKLTQTITSAKQDVAIQFPESGMFILRIRTDKGIITRRILNN